MFRYLLLALLVLLTGCTSTNEKEPDWAPPPLANAEPQQVVEGSLFNPAYANSLFEDRMAYRVGDILTVRLDEQTRSRKSSDTNFNKSGGAAMAAPVVWGNTGKPINYDLSRDFSGDSSSSQENMLNGSITVSVIAVLPNGALKVRGEKWIRLNQGDEYIRISGILRPEDITPDNAISSQRLANAQITYSAEGALAEANEAGWFTRLLNHPFFPL